MPCPRVTPAIAPTALTAPCPLPAPSSPPLPRVTTVTGFAARTSYEYIVREQVRANEPQPPPLSSRVLAFVAELRRSGACKGGRARSGTRAQAEARGGELSFDFSPAASASVGAHGCGGGAEEGSAPRSEALAKARLPSAASPSPSPLKAAANPAAVLGQAGHGACQQNSTPAAAGIGGAEAAEPDGLWEPPTGPACGALSPARSR